MYKKFAAYWHKESQLGFSSKIEMPQLGSARLGNFIGKFQLGPITTIYPKENIIKISDLAHVLVDFSQSEKLSVIKPPSDIQFIWK